MAKEKRAVVTDVLKEAIRTKTRVYVNLAQPELAEIVAARNVDGVGLLRAEFMVAQIGEHPRHMISQKRGNEFIDKLSKDLSTFAKAFNPRPVVYRTNDFKTNEYRKLKGGDEYEEVEENPMLGYRGVLRYTTDTDLFKLELEAIKKVRQEYQNLWVMIPFVRTVQGLTRTKEIMEAEGLVRSDDFKLWNILDGTSTIIHSLKSSVRFSPCVSIILTVRSNSLIVPGRNYFHNPHSVPPTPYHHASRRSFSQWPNQARNHGWHCYSVVSFSGK